MRALWSAFENGRPRRAAPTFIVVVVLVLYGCKSQGEPAAGTGNVNELVTSTTPPFQTKEPERYQATRTITITTADGKTAVTKTQVAKDGESRRHGTDTASKRIAYLDLPEGRFVLLVDDKVYADVAGETGSLASEEEEITPQRFLHDDAGTTSYQNLGKDVVTGRHTNIYKAIVNSSNTGNVTPTETLIWIDEALNMPIRSETTSPDGTRITMELSNLTLDVDKSLFQIPGDYEKVAFSEFRKRLAATE